MLRCRLLVRRFVVCLLAAFSLGLVSSGRAQSKPPPFSLRDLGLGLPRAPLGAHCVGNVVCTEMGTRGVHVRLTGSMLVRDDRSVPGAALTPAASFTLGGWGEAGVHFPILLGPLDTPPLVEPPFVFIKGAFTPPYWIGTHGVLFAALTLPYGPFSAPDVASKPVTSRYEVGAAISGHLLWMLYYSMSVSGQLSPGGPPPRLLTGLEVDARFDGFNVFGQVTHSAAFCWGGASDVACQSNMMVLGGLRIPMVIGHGSLAAGMVRGTPGAEGGLITATAGLSYDEATRARYGDGIEKVQQLWIRLFNAVIDPYLDERCVLWDDDHKPMLDIGQKSKDGMYCERDGLRTPIHTHFDRDQRSTRVCYDKGLRNCILRRNSEKDAWEVVPQSQQARRPYLKDDCHVYEEGVALPLQSIGTKSSDGQACEWEGHRFPIGKKFWALPGYNVMCQDPTLKDCSIELPEKPMSTGKYVAGRGIEQPVVTGAQKVLDTMERGAQTAEDLATGGLDLRTWGEEALNTLKDGVSHLSPDEAKKRAKAFEAFAEEKAREFAEKPLHEQLGDAAETVGDGVVSILGNKGMGMLGAIGSGTSGVARTAEELEKVAKAEQKAARAGRRTAKAAKAEAEHVDREAAEHLAKETSEREAKQSQSHARHVAHEQAGHDASNPRNRAAFERYKDDLRKDMEPPHVRDPELVDTVKNLYRETATEGSGSTAAAVRKELQTGEATKGRFHSEKAGNRIRQLETWLKNNPKARPGDRAAAENLLQDMKNALEGMPKK